MGNEQNSIDQETSEYQLELFNKVLDWENGMLSRAETESLFQELVSNHLCSYFPGAVRRTAALLIRQGRIHA